VYAITKYKYENRKKRLKKEIRSKIKEIIGRKKKKKKKGSSLQSKYRKLKIQFVSRIIHSFAEYT
jgi:F0F1-type ATP synthase assembly protein I